jgi:chemotaxis protein CheY-P-specific phosphatase CheC
MLCRLADIQLGRPAGTTRTLEDIELPLVGEMGNVIGMHFLDALADAANLSLVPSPPAVLVDSAEAILDLSLAGSRNGQEALVARTLAESSGQQMEGAFLVMPSSSFVRSILECSRQQW